jgi:Caudovirus prohead serine protease
VQEEFDPKPARSAHNPEAIPERTLKEVRLVEFGPVTFPAYAGATASLRSLNDEFMAGPIVREPRVPLTTQPSWYLGDRPDWYLE